MEPIRDSESQLFDDFNMRNTYVEPPESAKSNEGDQAEAAILQEGRKLSDVDDSPKRAVDDGDKSYNNEMDSSQWSDNRVGSRGLIGKQSNNQTYQGSSRRGQQPPPSRSGTRAAHIAQQKKLQQLRASQIQAKSPYAQHFQSQLGTKNTGQAPQGTNGGGSGQSGYRNWNSGLKNNHRQSQQSSSSQKSHQKMLSQDDTSIVAGPDAVAQASNSAASRSGSGMQNRGGNQQRSGQNAFPYRQDMSSKDARRGGTAPEGASRANQGQYLQPPAQGAKINISRNPYGMLGVHQNQNMQGSNQEIIKFSNSQIDKGNNGTGTNSQQQNQLIAKIYGKSNKFVSGTTNGAPTAGGTSGSGQGTSNQTGSHSNVAAPSTVDRRQKMSQIRHMIAKQTGTKDQKFVNNSVLKPQSKAGLDQSMLSQDTDKKDPKHNSEQQPKGLRRIKLDQSRLKSVQQQQINPRGSSKEPDQTSKKDEKSRSVQQSRLLAQLTRSTARAGDAEASKFVNEQSGSSEPKTKETNPVVGHSHGPSGTRTETAQSPERKMVAPRSHGKKFLAKEGAQTAKPPEQRLSNMGKSLGVVHGDKGCTVLSTGSVSRAAPSNASSRRDFHPADKTSLSQLQGTNHNSFERNAQEIDMPSNQRLERIIDEDGKKIGVESHSRDDMQVPESRRNSREQQRFLQQRDIVAKTVSADPNNQFAFFQNNDEIGGTFWAGSGDAGSFEIVNEKQLNNTDLRIHGFTAPDDDKVDEAINPNFLYHQQFSDGAPESASMIKGSLVTTADHQQIITSDVDERQNDSDVFQYANANNVQFSEAPSAEKEAAPPAKAKEYAGEADLEALNRFFKQSEEQNRASGHEDPDSKFLMQRHHYNDMKHVQTSQGARTVSFKKREKQRQNTVQIDENSDEDLKSENYQNEADVESQFSDDSNAGNSSSAGNLTPPKLNRKVFSTKEVANEKQRPAQAPSSQMQKIQNQAKNSSSNSKLLKIKGKLRAQQFQNTQNVQGLSKLKYADNQAAFTDDQFKDANENSADGGAQRYQNNLTQQDAMTMGNHGDGAAAPQEDEFALPPNQRAQQLSKTIDPSASMGLGPESNKVSDGAQGAAKDDDRDDTRPTAMKQNLMTRRRDGSGATNSKQDPGASNSAIASSAPQNSRVIGRKDIASTEQNSRNDIGVRESSSQKRNGAAGGSGQGPLLNDLQAWPPSISGTNSGAAVPSGAPSSLNHVAPLQRGTEAIPVQPLGQQFEQWQRPPSRQKQPNQALGLDDDTRPKTRGNNQSGSLTGKPIMHHQFYGQPVIRSAQFAGPYEGHGERGTSKREGQGRERKRNIQQFINQQDTQNPQGNLMYHFAEMQGGAGGDGSRGYHGRNNNVTNKGASGQNNTGGHRVRMIDFFHQRNNNTNGFNSTDEYQQSAMQAFQNQYHQSKLNGQQVVYEDQRQQPSTQNFPGGGSLSGSGPMTNSLNTTAKNAKVRRGQRGKQHNSGMASSELQRPPSRHKDPPQNLGLDIYPPGMGFASPNEFDPPVGVSSQDILANNLTSVGNGVFSGFDMQNDPSMEANVTAPGNLNEGLSDSDFVDDVGLEPQSFFMSNGRHGHASSAAGASASIGQKQFKEDEDDFLESQYLTRGKMNQDNMTRIQDTDTAEGPERVQSRHQGKRSHKFKRQQSDQVGGFSRKDFGGGTSGDRQQPNFTHIQISGHQRRGNGKYGSQRVNESTHSSQLNQTMGGIQPQQFAQTYGHGMMMGPLGLGSMQSNGHNSNQIFQYHPAMQQTKNFYISINQIKPSGGNEGAALMSDLFNMSADVQNIIKNSGQSKSIPFRHEEAKSTHQSKRLISTSQGPGLLPNQAAGVPANAGSVSAYMRQNADSTQKGGSSGNAAQLNYRQPGALANQEMLQRGFANQRSPVNDRSGSIHHLIMQNPHFKQINKPKSATGHRISGNKNRLKNLNNSGRFFGQNSTIIHSAYSNNNPSQQMRMYMQPKTDNWLDGMQKTSGPENPSSTTQPTQLITNDNVEDLAQGGGDRPKFSKQQIQKALTKQPAPGATVGSTKGAMNNKRRGNQFFLRGESTTDGGTMQLSGGNGSGGAGGGSMLQQLPSDPSLTDNAQELIKRGQELNQQRPKESQGYRSTDKRQHGLNTNSLGVTSTGGLAEGTATAGSSAVNTMRYQGPAGNNTSTNTSVKPALDASFVSSPTRTAEKRGAAAPFSGGFKGASAQQKFLSVYQVSSFAGKGKEGSQSEAQSVANRQTRHGKRGMTQGGQQDSSGIQQSLIQATDRLHETGQAEDNGATGNADLSERQRDPDNVATDSVGPGGQQNSFKSQTLQLPNNFNSGFVDEEFLNLFANQQ